MHRIGKWFITVISILILQKLSNESHDAKILKKVMIQKLSKESHDAKTL